MAVSDQCAHCTSMFVTYNQLPQLANYGTYSLVTIDYITYFPHLMGNMIQHDPLMSNKSTATHYHLPSTISSCLPHSRGLWGAEEHSGTGSGIRRGKFCEEHVLFPRYHQALSNIAFHSSPAAVERKWNEKEKKEAKSSVEKDSKSWGKNKIQSFSIPHKCSMAPPCFTNFRLHPYFLALHLLYLNSAVSLLSSVWTLYFPQSSGPGY